VCVYVWFLYVVVCVNVLSAVLQAVDVLATLPRDWEEKVVADAKWKDRKVSFCESVYVFRVYIHIYIV